MDDLFIRLRNIYANKVYSPNDKGIEFILELRTNNILKQENYLEFQYSLHSNGIEFNSIKYLNEPFIETDLTYLTDILQYNITNNLFFINDDILNNNINNFRMNFVEKLLDSKPTSVVCYIIDKNKKTSNIFDTIHLKYENIKYNEENKSIFLNCKSVIPRSNIEENVEYVFFIDNIFGIRNKHILIEKLK